MLPIGAVSALFAGADPADAVRAIVAQYPHTRLALATVSRSLSKALDDILAFRPTKNKKAPLKAFTYLLRLASRCTPFGLCATVGAVDKGSSTTLRFDGAERAWTNTRPDMAWLRAQVSAVESDSILRDKIRVRFTDLAFRRADRLYVMHLDLTRPRQVDNNSVFENTPVSLRYTEAIAYVEEIASTGIVYKNLIDAVNTRFSLGEERARRLIDQLWNAGVLLSTLRPSPMGEPVAAFTSACAQVDETRSRALEEVDVKIRAFDGLPVSERSPDQFFALEDALNDHHAHNGSLLQVDSYHHYAGTLGADVVRDIERFVSILARAAPTANLDGLRDAFYKKYQSLEQTVPLLEFADSDFGIGVPPAGGISVIPPTLQAERSRQLTDLAMQCAREKALEVELDLQDFERLFSTGFDLAALPDSLDFGLEICARSAEAVNSGDYLIAVGGFISTMDSFRTAGRFARGLGDAFIERMSATAKQRACKDQIDAELVYLPPWTRGTNVLIRPPLFEYEIQIGLFDERPGVKRLDLHDLRIGYDQAEQRFYIYSVSLGKRVRVHETHAFNTPLGAPNVVRLLSQLVGDRRLVLKEVDWGYAPAVLPFRPRIRHGRFVLSRAQWTLPTKRITGDLQESRTYWAEFCALWNVPKYVYLTSADHRLLLDTTTDLALAIIRDQAEEPTINLIETLDGLAAWVEKGGEPFASEFIATIVRNEPPAPARPVTTPAVTPVQESIKPPGSDWTYMKLYCSPNLVEQVLKMAVRPMLGALVQAGLCDQWFFLRYGDPRNHLRLRFHAAPGNNETLSLEVSKRCAALVYEQIVESVELGTYSREIERYGGLEGMKASERVFSLSSDLALRAFESGAAKLEERFVRSLSSFYFIYESFLAAGATAEDWSFPKSHLKLANFERTILRRARELVLAREFALHESFAREVASGLVLLGRDGSLTRPLSIVLSAHVHMHCNRFGLDESAERRFGAIFVRLLSSMQHAATTA